MPHILNVAPVIFEGGAITIEKVAYSKELFDQLHLSHRRSHLIKRSGDNIRLIPLRADAPVYGGEPVTVNLKDDLSLVASLAREAMYRHLLHKDCWVSGMKPISYLVTRKNLLEECMPANVTHVKGLGVYAKWEVDFRVVNPSGTAPFVGMSICISTAPRIAINCQMLLAAGFPIVGSYVGVSHSGKNPELKPHFLTIGKVSRVLGNGIIELEDVKEGYESQVDPITVFLEPREDILEKCIRFYYRENAEQILGNLERKTSAFHTGKSKYDKLHAGLKAFSEFNLNLVDNVPFRLGDFMTDATLSGRHFKIFTAEKPLFVFSVGGSHNSPYNDFGLQKYGPYSKEFHSPAKPRICIVCQAKKKGQVEIIFQKFLNGITPVAYGSSGKTYEFTGLKTKYYLQDCNFEFFISSDDSAGAYNKAITEALRAASNGKSWDIALVQIDQNFRSRPPDNNPYLIAKSRFVSQGVPVQEFTLESLGLPDDKVVWTLNNMALATYAKLGGVPWLLAADKPIAHEVVFGIGSSNVQNSRFGQRERMIGITTVFTGDGNYFLNNISAAVPADDYFETLLTNLRTTMEQVKKFYNWQARDTVRLIFHAFKTFKDTEANAVKQVMGELGDYDVEFAFVHVAATHQYQLFDTTQQGIGQSKKGVYAPQRAKYLQLSEHVSLVSLTGAQELKKAADGLPQPVQLILHRDSTFTDMTYLSRQVVKFGSHSWRSFQPAPMPVTVYYSQLMAQMIGQLSSISTWNSDALFNKIGKTRWFL